MTGSLEYIQVRTVRLAVEPQNQMDGNSLYKFRAFVFGMILHKWNNTFLWIWEIKKKTGIHLGGNKNVY